MGRRQCTRLLFFFLFLFLPFFSHAESILINVQKKLKALGYYHGIVDGIPGSKTNAAIRRYQIKYHLTITGELNDETLRSLKIQPSSTAPQ